MKSFERQEQPPMSLERASEADIPALLEVERSVPETNTYSPMLTEDEWKEALEGETVYLIRSGNQAAGNLSFEQKSPEHIHISGVVVRPEFQSRGLARAAIMQILSEHPEATRIDLAVHPENPALKLYESLGFKLESRVENYYGDGEPRLIMTHVQAPRAEQ